MEKDTVEIESNIIGKLLDPLEAPFIVLSDDKMKYILELTKVKNRSKLDQLKIKRYIRNQIDPILVKYDRIHREMLIQMKREIEMQIRKINEPISDIQKVLILTIIEDIKIHERKIATEKAKIRNKERSKSDIQFLLRKNLRSRLYAALKGKIKRGSAIKYLGCSVDAFKKHIESQWEPGMSWENYGNKSGQWSLDHIVPLSAGDLRDSDFFSEVCHFSNIRPMWHLENIKKGNKLIY